MFEIEWTQKALDQLAEIWLASSERDGVTAANHHAESSLRRNPFDCGESRISSVSRVLFEPPLYFEFDIVADDKKVKILRVGST